MIVGIAKAVLDHGQPLEVVADLGLLGHADAAMQLDRLLADELADLPICTFAAAIAVARSFASSKSDAMVANIDMLAGLLDGNEHVGGAVLQGLEAADRHAELGAGLEVFDGSFERFIDDADGFRAHRGAGLVDHALDQR